MEIQAKGKGMSQYRVKMIIDGRSTSVIISAYNAGNNARLLETNMIFPGPDRPVYRASFVAFLIQLW